MADSLAALFTSPIADWRRKGLVVEGKGWWVEGCSIEKCADKGANVAVTHPILFDGSMILVAASSVYYAIQAVKSGETFVWRGIHAKRSDNPVLFWYGVLQWVIAATVYVLAMFIVQR